MAESKLTKLKDGWYEKITRNRARLKVKIYDVALQSGEFDSREKALISSQRALYEPVASGEAKSEVWYGMSTSLATARASLRSVCHAMLRRVVAAIRIVPKIYQYWRRGVFDQKAQARSASVGRSKDTNATVVAVGKNFLE